VSLGAPALGAQARGTIVGTAYDSLSRAPLARAEVQVRGTSLRAVADSSGRFRVDGVPAGAHLLLLTHAGLDSAGLYTLTAPVRVDTGPVVVAIASPSLATIWRRLCGRPTPFGTGDTAIAFGTVSDAATGARFAGAVVRSSWRALSVIGPTDVTVRPLGTTVVTDSLGNYYACGLTADMTVRLRAFASGDSSGAVEVVPGGRPVVRRDFTIGRAAVRQAALRGAVERPDGTPVPDAQVIVEEGRQRFAGGDGSFLLEGLPAGTRWLIVRAVGYTPTAQAVDLRDGDTVQVRVTLALAPVVLDTVRVRASPMSRELQGFEERRRSGFGFMLTEDQLKQRASMRSVFLGVPQLRVTGPALGQFHLTFQMASGGTCAPTIFIDGRQRALIELYDLAPDQLAGVEVYARPSLVPPRFQVAMSTCGVIVVWTKTLR
jgi:hypothetical protein